MPKARLELARQKLARALKARVSTIPPPRLGNTKDFTTASCIITEVSWASGEIGIHVRFRCVCRKVWRFESSLAHSQTVHLHWAGGETGIHVRLRCVCRKVWRFESSPAHQIDSKTNGRLAQLARAPLLHRGGRGFKSLIVHRGLIKYL